MAAASPPPFIGHRRELAALQEAFADTCAGRGRLCLVSGEAGIGKTRLAEELAAHAEATPARVLWGCSWEHGGAPGYWPWIQILRRISRVGPAAALDEGLVGDGAQVLSQLIGEHRAGEVRSSALAADMVDAATIVPPSLASESARFVLFDAVTARLRTAAQLPLVLIFDDLHAADVSSLLLFEFAARELRDAKVLLLGIYREGDVDTEPACALVLTRIARLGRSLALAGWSDEDIRRFVEDAWQQSPAPALTGAVLRLTEGNPLYVVEMLRQLALTCPGALPRELPASPPIPAGMRHSIRARLAALDEPCRQALGVAAVIGREFDVELLRVATERPADQLLSQLSSAAAIGVVAPLHAPAARWSFRHGLIRATIYDDLPALERAHLHRRIGEALVALQGGDSADRLAETAHHLVHGVAAGGADVAFDYAVRAARSAAAHTAYEAAAARYGEALEILPRTRPGDAAARAELLLALGAAQLHVASATARATFQQAAAAARAARNPDLLGRAALGFAERGLGVPHQLADREAIALLDEACAALPDCDGTLRTRLLARLAVEHSVTEDPARGDALSVDALDMARRLDDPVCLAHALSARYFVLWRWDEIADRREVASELAQLAASLGDPELELQGRTWLILELMRAGDAVRLDAQIARYRPLAERLRHPRYLWMTANFAAMRALWSGNLAAAEGHIERARTLAERVDDNAVRFSPRVQLFALRREQGRLAEQEAGARLTIERSASPAPRTFLALLLCELGRLDEARRLFDGLAREDFADLRRERRIGVLPYLAEICAALGDAERAVLLYDLLLPLADSNVPYAASLCFGSGAHYLALLAEARGDLDLALGHFDVALARNADIDGAPWLARTQIAAAAALRRRGRPRDRERSEQLLSQALATARALGLQGLIERANRAGMRDESPARHMSQAVGHDGAELLAAPATPSGRVLAFPERVRRPRVPPAASGVPTRQGIFRREGEVWALSDGAALMRLKDSKGLRYLAQLLGRPGIELHVSELVALERGAPPPDAAAVAGLLQDATLRVDRGQGGEPLLDAKAQAAYRRRLEDLRDTLDEATRFNDVERAGRARAEMELLGRELARAVGLGGRDRSASSLGERARVNVTRAIAEAIKRITAHDAAFGRYFATTIKTGAFCSFTPDPRFPIDWQL